MNNNQMSGKPSIDRPWLQYYPEPMRNMQIPSLTIREYLEQRTLEAGRPAIDYYGNTFYWNDIWENVDAVAKSLRALGFGEGDRIPSFLQAVPEHLFLLLGAEKIGAALICRDDEPTELAFAIRKSKATVAFVPDYISKEDEDLFHAETPLQRMVTVSPYTYAKKECIPEHVANNLRGMYPQETACDPNNLTWEQFLALGKDYTGEVAAPRDPSRPVYGAYTSGSTGVSKLVIHSAENMVGVVYQMAFYAPPAHPQQKWLHFMLPPALIAVTVSMMLFPLSAGKLLILDPFCRMEDFDLEFMRVQPNFCPTIPMMYYVLMDSKRIPADYDMSFFLASGSGAEPLNDRKNREVEAFFRARGCNFTLSAGYGMSEGGSNFTMPMPLFPMVDGCVGMPMPAINISICDPNTDEELGYGEIGEICKAGIGNMLGYQSEEQTRETMRVHADGQIWLHTGDYGYITKEGILHVLGRGLPERYEGGHLFMMRMESRVVEVSGVSDAFFVFAPDQEHEGYFLPYMYVMLNEGVALEEIESDIRAVLEEHEQPVEITVIKERPFFHFKTNRKGLTAEILRRGQKSSAAQSQHYDHAKINRKNAVAETSKRQSRTSVL